MMFYTFNIGSPIHESNVTVHLTNFEKKDRLIYSVLYATDLQKNKQTNEKDEFEMHTRNRIELNDYVLVYRLWSVDEDIVKGTNCFEV